MTKKRNKKQNDSEDSVYDHVIELGLVSDSVEEEYDHSDEEFDYQLENEKSTGRSTYDKQAKPPDKIKEAIRKRKENQVKWNRTYRLKMKTSKDKPATIVQTIK